MALSASIPLSLALDFAWKEMRVRHSRSFLGTLWLFLSPLLMLSIYTLVFSGILGLRMNSQGSGVTDYALSLAAGLVMYFFIANVITDAPSTIVQNAHLVKRRVFPLPVLVLAKWLAEIAALMVSLSIVTVFLWAHRGHLAPTTWLLPVAVLPSLFFSLGAGFFLAALGVYFPDIREILKPALQVLLYLAPVLYPITLVPEPYRAWAWFNPLTPMVQSVRGVLVDGTPPEAGPFLLYTAVSAVFLAASVWFFRKTRTGFADVL